MVIEGEDTWNKAVDLLRWAICRLSDTSCYYLRFPVLDSHDIVCIQMFPYKHTWDFIKSNGTKSSTCSASPWQTVCEEMLLTSDISNTSRSLNKDLGCCWDGISLWNPQLQRCAYLGTLGGMALVAWVFTLMGTQCKSQQLSRFFNNYSP